MTYSINDDQTIDDKFDFDDENYQGFYIKNIPMKVGMRENMDERFPWTPIKMYLYHEIPEDIPLLLAEFSKWQKNETKKNEYLIPFLLI